MTPEQTERLVKAFEDIADAARRFARSHEGLEQSAKNAVDHLWPEKKEPRPAQVTHVPTEEEKLREKQQGTEQSDDWLRDLTGGETEFIGEREREWIRTHPKEQPAEQGTDSPATAPGAEEAKGQA